MVTIKQYIFIYYKEFSYDICTSQAIAKCLIPSELLYSLPSVTERTTTGFSLPAIKPNPSTASRVSVTSLSSGGASSRSKGSS